MRIMNQELRIMNFLISFSIVIPALFSVIPAKAGIQVEIYKNVIDPRIRKDDNQTIDSRSGRE